VQQLEILAFLVCYFLLANVFEIFICLLLTCQKFLVGLLLLSNLIAPIVHPFHSIEMGAGDKASFDLNPLEFIIMLFFQQLLGALSRFFIEFLLYLFDLPDLLYVFHGSGVPYLLIEIV
jgi:hypothetical protein